MVGARRRWLMGRTRFTSSNKVKTVKAGRINGNFLWDPKWRVEGIGRKSYEDSGLKASWPSGKSARLGGRQKNIIESEARLLTAVKSVTLPFQT